MKATHRWLIAAVCVTLLIFGTCCCGVAGWVYEVLLFHAETYKPTHSPSLVGYPVVLRVVPKTRKQNRRVGPPYDFTLFVNHRIPNLVKWRLLSAHVERDDGRLINAEILTAEGQPSIHGIMSLSGVFEQGDWGKRPKLVAKIELVYSDRTVREKLTFPLEWEVDSHIYIP